MAGFATENAARTSCDWFSFSESDCSGWFLFSESDRSGQFRRSIKTWNCSVGRTQARTHMLVLVAEGHCEAPVLNPGPKIEIPHPENHVLKVFRFRSWKPRVWKSKPQSWDHKSRKPCPENHILKFPRPQSWNPKSGKPYPENHILKFSEQHRRQFRAKTKKKKKTMSLCWSRSWNLTDRTSNFKAGSTTERRWMDRPILSWNVIGRTNRFCRGTSRQTNAHTCCNPTI